MYKPIANNRVPTFKDVTDTDAINTLAPVIEVPAKNSIIIEYFCKTLERQEPLL